MQVRLTISGRSYDVAADVPASLTFDGAATLDDALARLTTLLPDGAALADTSLVAVGGRHLGTLAVHEPCELCDGDELLIITPVAGG